MLVRAALSTVLALTVPLSQAEAPADEPGITVDAGGVLEP